MLTKPKALFFPAVGETSSRHVVLYLEVALEARPESTACQANRKICSLIMCGIWLKTTASWQDEKPGTEYTPALPSLCSEQMEGWRGWWFPRKVSIRRQGEGTQGLRGRGAGRWLFPLPLLWLSKCKCERQIDLLKDNSAAIAK